MKVLILISMTFLSFSACAKEQAAKKTEVKAIKEVKDAKGVTAAPCDTKEDILKKLEEEKKAKEEKGKGFSLQGGNTGCSVK